MTLTRIYTIIFVLLGAFAPRLASASLDYLIISILCFGHSLKPIKKIFSLSINKFIFIMLLVLIPLIIGLSNPTFDFYQLGRFVLGYSSFCIFMLLCISSSQISISEERLESMNTNLIFIVSIASFCAILRSFFPDLPFPVYISTDISSPISFLGARLYPLASAAICSLASLHRLKHGYVYLFAALITVFLSQGKSLLLLTLIAIMIPYSFNIFRILISRKFQKKIIWLILIVFLTSFFAPWSRIIGDKNSLDINPFEAKTTRNIMALDAVNNTFSNPISAMFGLGFATKTNSGYSLVQDEVDDNSKLVRNAQYSTENFYGSSLSRLGVVGLFYILFVTCFASKQGKFVYFLIFTLVGLGSGFIEDSSYGSALVVLFFANNNLLLCSNKR